MAEVQVARVTPRHEAIIAHLIANPTQQLGRVAASFNVSAPWLSVLMHSDAFRARLKERQDEFFSEATIPVAKKLEALATLAVDKLIEEVPFEPDLSKVNAIARTALDRIGHNGQPNGGSAPLIQNNFITVEASQLAAARERIAQRGLEGGGGNIIEHDAQADRPTAEEL